MRSSQGLFRHEQGAAAVEMALILPIMLLLLFGIIDIGRYYWAQHSVVHAVNEATRLAVLEGVTEDEINRVVTFHLRDWDKTLVPQVVENASGAGSTASVTVSVSMPFTFLLLPGFVAGKFAPRTISHSVTMRSER